MDKSWMQESRVSNAYFKGVGEFLDFAFANSPYGGNILCPCIKCNNAYWHNREVVHEHMVCLGIVENYTCWSFHGEAASSSMSGYEDLTDGETGPHDDMHGLLHDRFGISNSDGGVGDPPHEPCEGLTVEAEKFFKLLKDAEQELYPSCKRFTKLSFVVRLYHIKCLGGLSNKAFTWLLELLKEAFPEGETLPKSFYETKKIIEDLGLRYNKIDACPNDCMLYWKESANASECSICGASRWKIVDNHSDYNATSSRKDKKIPAKILRHFPLKPRLQRLFMSSKTASSMRWHEEGRTKDGILRHPADSPAWKTFNYLHPSFSSDPRNVRLGLASDGFNPFRTMSIAHSTWPVIVIPYNLPPWMCMKQPYFMLSILIPGPSAPGNDIDVYLQPLIEELKELWEDGLDTYDASSNQSFRMRAALMWTINDFPAYANLSGWSTKGRLACPICNKDTCSHYLKYGRKFCYMGHRRFLEHDHRFRHDKRSFNGDKELGSAPTLLSGSDVLRQLQDTNITFGKKNHDIIGNSRKRNVNEVLPFNWKKRSIFFELPYWETNLLRHNLDVMHIEKNVCNNLLGTLLNIEGKTKDNEKACLDLKHMHLRPTLHPRELGPTKRLLPPACFSMAPNEKVIFCKVLKGVKLPDGYAANVSRHVHLKERKILGLKSHDCHVLMQQLLPLAVRRVLPTNVSSVVIELCRFFRELCSKVGQVKDFERLESQIAQTLCHLERIFPPAFFDIMVHLPIHLANEARVAGPVQYRWMYPIERYLLTLKSYVRNRSRPEGSIAEGYLAEECLTFCSRYLHGVETRFSRPIRNYDDGDIELHQGSSIFSMPGRGIGKLDMCVLDQITRDQAHRYVLFNCNAVFPFIDQHLSTVKVLHQRLPQMDIERIHHAEFPNWFRDHVQSLRQARNEQVPEEVSCLASGPNNVVRRYKGYIVNSFRFHRKDIERKRKTQNSGVVVNAKTSSFASSRDGNPVTGDVSYYGILTDIIELDYGEHRKVVLFRCDWFDVLSQGRGIKIDEFGFTLVNFSRLISTGKQLFDEPFVLASQAEQVFYVQDPIETDWHVVIKTKPRDLFDMHEEGSPNDIETYGQIQEGIPLEDTIGACDDNVDWVRTGITGITINTPLVHTQAMGDDDLEDEYEFDDGAGDDAMSNF